MSGLVALVSCSHAGPVGGEVHIHGSRGRLAGTVQVPEGEGRKPVAIIFHGLTGYRTEDHLMALNDSLLARGIATVRFDFNGHGESDGCFSGMTLANEMEDARAIFHYVESLSWVDTTRISVAGHSQGGLEAGLLAGELGSGKIRSAVLMAPAACIPAMVESGDLFGFDLSGGFPDSLAFWGGRYLGKAYLESALACHPFEQTARYTGPVLVLQAMNDNPVLMRVVERYRDCLPQAEYIELPGLTHCFPEDLATPARLAADFIARASR